MKAKLGNVVLLFVTTAVCAILLEAATRIYFGVPLFSGRDWRTLNATTMSHGAAHYDAELGWIQTSGFTSAGFNTITYGIRKNTAQPEKLSAGSVLAVGDSFTAGSEVSDGQSWPAQLEKITGERTLNAGVGGFGTDQIILFAERLLPLLKPKTVIIDFLTEDVERAGYSTFGRPKPYFIEDKGQLMLENNPVPTSGALLRSDSFGKRFLAHSFVAHMIAQRLAPEWWMGIAMGSFQRIGNNPISVTCKLLDRLHNELAASGTRGVLVMQYGGGIFSRGAPRPYHAEEVLRCASKAGFDTVDEYPTLSQIARKSIATFKTLYVMHDDGRAYGHMSEAGNKTIAGLIADRLRQPRSVMAPSNADDPQPAGGGINVIGEESSFTTTNARIQLNTRTGTPLREPLLKITSTGSGEHYVSALWSASEPKTMTFSLYVRDDPQSAVRLQLLDRKTNGIIADFLTRNRVFNIYRIGSATRLGARAEPVSPGWLRVSITAELLDSSGSVIVQLMRPDFSTNFSGGIEPLEVQGLMVEEGSGASAYCSPKACNKQASASH